MSSSTTTSPNHQCISIAMYTFKGGNAKTTVTMHLAGTLASLGHRVCIIDADPQANLSDTMREGVGWDDVDKKEFHKKSTLKRTVSKSNVDDPDPEPKVLMDETDINDCQCPKMSNFIDLERMGSKPTIYDIFKPIFQDTDASESIRQMNKPSLLAEVNWKKPGNAAGGSPSVLDGKLWLLRGSNKMRDFDGRMGTEMQKAGDSLDSQAYVGVCNKMLKEIGSSKGLDFILVDMSPSPGAMNEAMAMSCDYILPPAFAEPYSAMAAYGILTENLPSWFERKTRILECQEDSKNEFALDNTYPRLLPFILTNYNINEENGHLNELATMFVTCVEDFVLEWQEGKMPPQTPVDVPKNKRKHKRLVAAAKLIENRMSRCDGLMTIPLVPHDAEIFKVCQEIGRTLPELSYDFLIAEGYSSDSLGNKITNKAEVQARLEEYQNRYISFANWLVWKSRQNNSKWKGYSGKWIGSSDPNPDNNHISTSSTSSTSSSSEVEASVPLTYETAKTLSSRSSSSSSPFVASTASSSSSSSSSGSGSDSGNTGKVQQKRKAVAPASNGKSAKLRRLRSGLTEEMVDNGWKYHEKTSKWSTNKIKTWSSPDGKIFKQIQLAKDHATNTISSIKIKYTN